MMQRRHPCHLAILAALAAAHALLPAVLAADAYEVEVRPGVKIPMRDGVELSANVFLPGHKIRVEISSSNFPRFDRNPNTGHPFGADAELKTATQTVYHDAEHASHIVLPVIP